MSWFKDKSGAPEQEYCRAVKPSDEMIGYFQDTAMIVLHTVTQTLCIEWINWAAQYLDEDHASPVLGNKVTMRDVSILNRACIKYVESKNVTNEA